MNMSTPSTNRPTPTVHTLSSDTLAQAETLYQRAQFGLQPTATVEERQQSLQDLQAAAQVGHLDSIVQLAQIYADGVMIGRGALGNPWLFRDIRAWLAGHEVPGPPSLSERSAVFLQHVELMQRHTPPKRFIHEVRKAVAWYTKGLPGSAELRDIHKAPTDPLALIGATTAYFGSLLSRGDRRVALELDAAPAPVQVQVAAQLDGGGP